MPTADKDISESIRKLAYFEPIQKMHPAYSVLAMDILMQNDLIKNVTDYGQEQIDLMYMQREYYRANLNLKVAEYKKRPSKDNEFNLGDFSFPFGQILPTKHKYPPYFE